MGYKLYGPDGREIIQYDLQDKGFWCETGKTQEETFVEKFGKAKGLIINPAKGANPYAPDLFNTVSGSLGDLKTQNTPFFKAETLYGLPPQYTVVFNLKDKERYEANYPDLEIYFAVDWLVTKFVQNGKTFEVEPMRGVWYIPFQQLNTLLAEAPLHRYQQRIWDQNGNAKASFVLNLQWDGFTRVS